MEVVKGIDEDGAVDDGAGVVEVVFGVDVHFELRIAGVCVAHNTINLCSSKYIGGLIKTGDPSSFPSACS